MEISRQSVLTVECGASTSLDRKISEYSESDKTGMEKVRHQKEWLVYKESLRNWTKQQHVTGPAYCPLLADVLAERVGIANGEKH